ncbi:hypothetical protein DSCA_23080 [Desulfosarcina alkanivorans]|uniref:Uncharacterized protein n=1 Tax=Desulfosarcina alkanivorans TaxID=571177 RepID=A0A5K7YH58_9BACT|nr:hypothetical protein [Desulfosarcina alkanivorans]BBO68378.1 hypothetical protein DSCA_23080 [Desulfosarcina alkanivorans]
MYSNGGGLGIGEQKKRIGKIWQPGSESIGQSFRNGKCFVCCICPKCGDRHNVYMLWTGRGVPRKYCGNCKPMISGYDDAAFYEAAISAPGHSKKKGRRHEGE